jgi:cytochrome c oxidase subunit IV
MPEHVVPRRAYVLVYAVLVVLTVTTVLVAYVNLGTWNPVAALGIAAAKATLIALFFMHVRHSTGTTRLFVVGAVLWLGILIAGTLDDVVTRGLLAVPGR